MVLTMWRKPLLGSATTVGSLARSGRESNPSFDVPLFPIVFAVEGGVADQSPHGRGQSLPGYGLQGAPISFSTLRSTKTNAWVVWKSETLDASI